MTEEEQLFILAGNGPYANLGCEAIVRGTTKIMRDAFKNPRFVCLTHFRNEAQFHKQRLEEVDPSISHVSAHRMSMKYALSYFWKPDTWSYAYRQVFDKSKLKNWTYQDLLPYLNQATAVLSIGGDNYSLDYGIPKHFTDLDDIVLGKEKPLIIWGASIGPFDKIPDYEEYMKNHLRKVTGIFARESSTIEYLREIGVTENVRSISDPAFMMDPVCPDGIEEILPIGEEMIGINLSPLMAKYVTDGDLNEWVKKASMIVSAVSQKTEMPICLIPHVTNPASNDYTFMQQILNHIENNRKIYLIPPKYNAAETKWIIGHMSIFAGARTHSTIASLSSCVPTLSFTYSMKGRGINQDLFGHIDYCIEPTALNAEKVTDKITFLLDKNGMLRKYLNDKMPEIKNEALNAGIKLRHLLNGS